jgi:hypothetical protein
MEENQFWPEDDPTSTPRGYLYARLSPVPSLPECQILSALRATLLMFFGLYIQWLKGETDQAIL